MISDIASTNENNRLKTCWIIGCGDIGKRVSALFAAQPKPELPRVKALVSSAESVEQCQIQDIEAYALDLDSSYSFDGHDFLHGNDFDQADIFYFAPPTPTGDKDQRLQIFYKY